MTQVSHILYAMTTEMMEKGFRLDPNEFYNALTQPGFTGHNRCFYSEYGKYIFGDWFSLLRNALSENTP